MDAFKSFAVKMTCENDAFVDYPHDECARILGEIAASLKQGKDCGAVMDLNGNKVGDWGFGI